MNQTPDGVKSADIRLWATGNGWPQLEGRNGRLPSGAILAYLTAHGLVEPAPVDLPPPVEGDV